MIIYEISQHLADVGKFVLESEIDFQYKIQKQRQQNCYLKNKNKLKQNQMKNREKINKYFYIYNC